MTEQLLNKQQLKRRLESAIAEAGGVTAFARKYQISQSYVSEARNGKSEEIGPSILAALGVVRVERFMVIRPSAPQQHEGESPCPAS